MHRTFVSLAASDVSNASNAELYGQLSGKLSFPVEPTQRSAWNYQINHLRELANNLPDAHFSMEFLIPRMGRRADLIILLSGFVFVVEYKVGSKGFDRTSLNQTYGYGLDLKHFHEPTAGAAHEGHLDGLRNIGNLGTHGGEDVDDDDLFDALEVLQFALTGIYDTKSINAKAAKLKAKTSGT